MIDDRRYGDQYLDWDYDGGEYEIDKKKICSKYKNPSNLS